MILFAKDIMKPEFCSVAIALHIWNRSECFFIPNDHAIVVIIDIKGKTKTRSLKYIDDIHIGTLLKDTANTVYSITSKRGLAQFTAHSIRVGSCVIMQTNGPYTSMIQVRHR